MIKISHIFEKGNANKNWKKIEKWIDDEDVSGADLMAIVCAKFGSLPQVRSNEITEYSTRLMVAGEIFKITIEKEHNQ